MNAVRTQLREQQQALAREHVLDAAEAVVAERGLHATTLRDIAARAEYSVGALYQFFDGKRELLTALMTRHNDVLLAALEHAVAAAPDPPAALHAVVDVEVDHFARAPGAWRLFEETFGGGLNLARRVAERGVDPTQYTSIMAVHERVLRAGARSGDFARGDAAMLATMLTAIVTTYISAAMERTPRGFTRDDLHALVDRTFSRPR